MAAVVWSQKEKELQINVLERKEGSSACLECLPSLDYRRVSRSHERQRHGGGIPKEARRTLFLG